MSSQEPPSRAGTRPSESPEELAALYAQCTRFLNGSGQRSTTAMLDLIPKDTEPDVYGNGGVVEALEQRIAGLLAKPAALFMPTGTMAQQASLRIHSDARSCRTVVFHPACHLDTHEERAYERLHSLTARPVGGYFEPLSALALESVAEPVAALLIELPQRDLGGALPSWDELLAQVQWARSRGAATHLDGARLFEAMPYYESQGHTWAELAELFDTVYISFYKGLGALGGCCVAGDERFIDELRVWRTRHGGRIWNMWPYAAAATSALDRRQDRFGDYYRRAQQIERRLRRIEGIEVLPEHVVSPMMHVRVHGRRDRVIARMRTVARRERVWMFAGPFLVESPTSQRFEFNVGDATMDFSVKEVRDLFARVAGAT